MWGNLLLTAGWGKGGGGKGEMGGWGGQKEEHYTEDGEPKLSRPAGLISRSACRYGVSDSCRYRQTEAQNPHFVFYSRAKTSLQKGTNISTQKQFLC